MQKTADILPGTKCQSKKQSGRGTEELIYTQEGDFTCQSFSWGRSASTFSHVPLPNSHSLPSILTNHSILRLSLFPKSLDAAHPGGPARSYIAPITVKLELWVKHKSIGNLKIEMN